MFDPTFLTAITLTLYLAAEGFSIAHLRSDKASWEWAAFGSLILGFLIHFAALYLGARATHSVPYRDLTASMSFFAWVVIASYGILILRHREGSTGPFLLPIAILFLGVSMLMHQGHAVVVPDPKRAGMVFAFHVTMAIVGYAALSLSFVLAQLYLIQNRQIRNRKLGLLFSRLPALDVLFRLHRTSVAIGVIALSIALVLGLLRAKMNWGTYWDPKVAFTFLIIAIYMFTLFPRWIAWGGKKVALLSIAGFMLVLFSYTIVNLFISSEHLYR